MTKKVVEHFRETELVNGAIIMSIASNNVTVQFDHASTPYNVERVKSKFMLMSHKLRELRVYSC